MFKIFFEFVANYFRSCFNYFKQERKETIFKIQDSNSNLNSKNILNDLILYLIDNAEYRILSLRGISTVEIQIQNTIEGNINVDSNYIIKWQIEFLSAIISILHVYLTTNENLEDNYQL